MGDVVDFDPNRKLDPETREQRRELNKKRRLRRKIEHDRQKKNKQVLDSYGIRPRNRRPEGTSTPSNNADWNTPAPPPISPRTPGPGGNDPDGIA